MFDDMFAGVVSFIGHSGCGKTTLLEMVIKELKSRGFRVGTVKHTHCGAEIDQPGKDTWRFARAGSDVVALASAAGIFITEYVEPEAGLGGVVALLKDKVDIILTEGYKKLPTLKVLVLGEDDTQPSFCGELLATVVACRAAGGRVEFRPEDVVRVAGLLADKLSPAGLGRYDR